MLVTIMYRMFMIVELLQPFSFLVLYFRFFLLFLIAPL